MIIMKKALARRTFLRGTGASLALPLLDAMVPVDDRAGRDARESGAASGLCLYSDGRKHCAWTPQAPERSPSFRRR